METSIIPQYKNIGVQFSGGIDSTLLLYMLNITHPNSNLYVFTGTRKSDAMYNLPCAKKILSALELKNLKEHLVKIWSNKTEGKSNRNSLRKEYTDKYNIDCWVNGITLNPPVNLGEGRDTNRDIVREKLTYIDGLEMYKPFASLDKRAIASLYEKFQIKETLLPLTISCEATTPPRPCRECWWCKEKYWGFGEY